MAPQLPPPSVATFCAVALFISALQAALDIFEAFKDQPFSLKSALSNRWALPLYLIYPFITALIGLALLEQGIISLSWAWAIGLGLGGPLLFRTHIKLFQPISGKSAPSIGMDRLISGVQRFCFSQINRTLTLRRIKRKENLFLKDEEVFSNRLRAILTAQEFEKIAALVEERRRSRPDSVIPFMVSLIEEKDASFLEDLLKK